VPRRAEKSKPKRPTRIEPGKVQEFVHSLNLLVDPDQVAERIARGLQDLFAATLVLVFQFQAGHPDLAPSHSLGFEGESLGSPRLSGRGRLAQWLGTHERCFEFTEELQLEDRLDPQERDLFRRLQTRVCVPLISLKRLIGVVLLGSKNPGWRLSPGALELLGMLSAHSALALQSALLHSQQKNRLHRIFLSERLATAGRLATGVAHEIRNPLTVIGSTMQYMAETLEEEDPRQALMRGVLDELERLNKTVEALLRLAPVRERHIEHDLLGPLEQALLLIIAQARQSGIALERSYSEDHFPIQGDPDQIQQVFLNVLLNALQVTGKGGTVSVRVEPWEDLFSGDRSVQVQIADSGPGIPPKDLERIFEPFFTTKPEGSGLGLAICQSLVERNGGEIDVESEVGKGTTLRIRFPLRV
jgi:signal transduction histidine kinase